MESRRRPPAPTLFRQDDRAEALERKRSPDGVGPPVVAGRIATPPWTRRGAGEEARQCELAWDWPKRRGTSETRLLAAMKVPPLMAKDLADEFNRLAVLERTNYVRRLRTRTDDRPAPFSAQPVDMLANLVEVAMTEAVPTASPETQLVASLCRCAWALDPRGAEGKAAAVHAAFHISAFQSCVPRGYSSDASRRRRGRDVDSPWRRVAAPPRLRTVRGDESRRGHD